MTRDEALAGSVSPVRAAKARDQAAVFGAFCERFDLDETSESVTLFLTLLAGQGLSGRQVRERLQLLDLARRLSGLKPWHQDADVRTFLRGLFAEKPVGERHSHYDPLYVELVHAMVDTCRVPSPDQQRALAAHLLREETGLSAAHLTRLRWSDVRLAKHLAEVTLTTKVGRGQPVPRVQSLAARPGHPRCPVTALRALRSLGGGEWVLGIEGRPIDRQRIETYLATADPLAPMPAQVRDPALLLMGFAAGLRTGEAMALRQQDVQPHDRGLVLAIAGRRRLTYLSSAPDPAYDPATAWAAWLAVLDRHGLCHPEGAAFRATNFSVVFDKRMHESGLNRMVHQRAEEAGLSGRFVWTSLRTGMMRTAVRNEARAYTIAAHADLVSLGSVQRHERRETLLGESNVAGRLGL